MLVAVIIGCEIMFWVFVVLGLVSRYLLRRKTTGKIFLFCTPLVDLTLLVITIININSGIEITFVHGLAAIYIGVSVAFGRQMIAWADRQFSRRFVPGSQPRGPQPPRLYGKEHAVHERRGWLRHLLAWCIGSAILFGIIFYVNNADRTGILSGIIKGWALILFIDFLISFSYTIRPRKHKQSD
jgi:hypothetical protein